MSWSEVLSIIATLAAAGSLGVTFWACRIAARQAWPHPNIGWISSSTGHRSLDFEIEKVSGGPDWGVKRASIGGNWQRRRYLARGVLQQEEEFEGEIINHYGPSGEWQRCIDFDSPHKWAVGTTFEWEFDFPITTNPAYEAKPAPKRKTSTSANPKAVSSRDRKTSKPATVQTAKQKAS